MFPVQERKEYERRKGPTVHYRHRQGRAFPSSGKANTDQLRSAGARLPDDKLQARPRAGRSCGRPTQDMRMFSPYSDWEWDQMHRSAHLVADCATVALQTRGLELS